MPLFEGEDMIEIPGIPGGKIPRSALASLAMPIPQPDYIPTIDPANATPVEQKLASISNANVLPPEGASSPVQKVLSGISKQSMEAPETPTQPIQAPQGVQGQPSLGRRATQYVGTPRSDAELDRLGYSGALRGQLGALDAMAQAGVQGAEAQQLANNVMVAAKEERNQVIDQAVENKNAQIAKDQAEIDGLYARQNKLREDYANTKIDRESDHPVMNWIGVVLAGLGTALAKDTSGRNPALEAMYRAIDRKVAGQMADLDKKGKVIGMGADQINEARANMQSRLGLQNQLIANELEKSARLFEIVGLKSNNEIIRANAAKEAAQLRGQAADLTMTAVQQEKAQRDKDRQLYETSRHNKATEALQRDELSARQQAAQDKATAEVKNATAKEIKEKGISGVMVPVVDQDGKPVVDQDGKPVLKNDRMRLNNGEIWIPDGKDEQIAKMRDKHIAAQKLVSLMDQVITLGPEWSSDVRKSAKHQQLRQMWGTALLEYAKAYDLGALAGGDVDIAFQGLGSKDPNEWNSGVSGIERARKTITQMNSKNLQGYGYDKEWDPPAPRPPVKTADEADLNEIIKGKIDTDRVPGAQYLTSSTIIDKGKQYSVGKKGDLDLQFGPVQYVEDKLQLWKKAAQGSGQAAEQARLMLVRVAQESENQSFREQASSILEDLNLSGMMKQTGAPEKVKGAAE